MKNPSLLLLLLPLLLLLDGGTIPESHIPLRMWLSSQPYLVTVADFYMNPVNCLGAN